MPRVIMKILFLTEDFGYPPIGGGQIRERYLIELLRETCEVEVLAYHAKFQAKVSPPLPPRITVHIVGKPVPSFTSLFKKIFYFFRPYFINGYNIEMERAIIQRASPNTVLWASRLTMGKYLHLGAKLGLKTVLDEHNVESRVLIHYALKSPLSWVHLIRAWKSRKYEGRLCDTADITLVTSQDDADRLQSLNPKADIQVVPTSLDVSRYTQSPETERSIDFLFLGSLNYGPNVEGLFWFTRKVLPELRALLKDTQPRITVAGANPAPSLSRELQAAGIHLDINPFKTEDLLAKSSVVFVPLLFGSGTRIKIMEAMAAQRAVVSTPIGAEGLGLHHDNGIWIAQTGHEFAKGMQELLTDASRRNKIATEASQIAKERFDWQVMRPHLGAVLERLEA